MKTSSRLFDLRQLNPRAPITCFCFPYAGGNSSVFYSWCGLLAPFVEVCMATLPGRGARFAESPYRTFQHLLKDLAFQIIPLVSKPFVAFGHSLGAIVAYELVHTLYVEHGIRSSHLFVSGTAAPHLPDPPTARVTKGLYKLGDETLLEKLRELGGIPDEVANDPCLLSLVLPTLRSDLEVSDNYEPPVYPERRRVPCPITAFGGAEDILDVPESGLLEWSRYTTLGFNLHVLPGNHFFLHDQAVSLTGAILAAVTR